MSASTQSIVSKSLWALATTLAMLLAACSRSNTAPVPAATQTEQPSQLQSTPAKPATELDQTLQKAQSGDASAMYRVGRMYATGSGVEKDYVEAFNWYKRAAKAGNTDAMYALGEAYEHGTGVREDIQQAVNWYDQATLRGNKAAKAALDRLGEDFDR
jgi:TPR repeat protein